ncbi:MAG: LLM class flavin-dependent oxidoreductase [Acidimicrobiales bacterium]|jgi:alkanesulfonate monooxygenase SsuD/methylene tetrahydromethanopterin reductase-like flavin-dependent oxidoreductase (luciferase family)
MSGPEFFLYLPQMRMGMDAITERAVAAESSGFRGVAFMDHLAAPLSERAPLFEAMTVATWVAARTTDLRVGHLVLCDAVRHPAVLARQCVTLDHASGGRFELGLGSGSVPAELVSYGVTEDGPAARSERLAETLELLEALWGGDPVVHHGRHFRVDCPGQQPTPLDRIPVVVGGSSPRTLELVRRHADWWNLPAHHLDRLDELRPRVGTARVSTQHLVAYVAEEAERPAVTGTAERRFGGMSTDLAVGDASELVSRFAGYHRRGVDRCYVWFTDFAPPATIRSFGRRVIGAFAS